MNVYRASALAGCLVILLGLTGCCAKPRTGPFDVPSGVSGAGSSTGSSNQAAVGIATAAIYFDFDRAAIRQDARTTLDQVASTLKQSPSIRIALQGHCDERGGEEYNYGLGERRARAAYTYLRNAGVPATQLVMVNHGEKSPAVPGRSESAYSRNRRVSFCVLTTSYPN